MNHELLAGGNFFLEDGQNGSEGQLENDGGKYLFKIKTLML